MKGLVAVLATLCAQGVSAQWGPWTQWWSAGLGAWQGDTAAFAVAESDWLLLDAPAAGTYALWRESLLLREIPQLRQESSAPRPLPLLHGPS